MQFQNFQKTKKKYPLGVPILQTHNKNYDIYVFRLLALAGRKDRRQDGRKDRRKDGGTKPHLKNDKKVCPCLWTKNPISVISSKLKKISTWNFPVILLLMNKKHLKNINVKSFEEIKEYLIILFTNKTKLFVTTFTFYDIR